MAPVDDAFSARVLREDRDDERTASAAYVSPEMTGWEELDRHGRWDQHPEYGAVWVPLSGTVESANANLNVARSGAESGEPLSSIARGFIAAPIESDLREGPISGKRQF